MRFCFWLHSVKCLNGQQLLPSCSTKNVNFMCQHGGRTKALTSPLHSGCCRWIFSTINGREFCKAGKVVDPHSWAARARTNTHYTYIKIYVYLEG